MELSEDTGRADAPLHASCRWNGGKLWPEKSCAGRTSLVRGLVFPEKVWICLFKRDYAWEIMLLMFYRTALPMGRIVTSVASICHISVLFSHIDIRQKLRADQSLRFTIHDTAVCLVGRKDKHLGNLYVCRG